MLRRKSRRMNQLLKLIGRIEVSEADLAKAQSIFKHERGQIDPEALFQMAQTQGIVPQIFCNSQKIKETGLEISELERFIEIANNEVVAYRDYMKGLFDKLEEFAHLTKTEEIKYVVVKGMSLQYLYPEGSFRAINDIDFVFSPESALTGIEIIKQIGFYLKRMRLESYSYSHSEEIHNRRGVFGVAQMYMGTGFWAQHFDVHLGAFPSCGDSILESELWTGLRTHSIGDEKVYLPSFEDAILIICAHISRHGYARLRDSNDIVAILRGSRGNLDWDYIFRYTIENSLQSILRALLHQVRKEYDVTFPKEISTRLPYRDSATFSSYFLFKAGKENPGFHGNRQLVLGRVMQTSFLFRYYLDRSNFITALRESSLGFFFLFQSGRPYKIWDKRVIQSFERNKRIVVVPILHQHQENIWRIREIFLLQAEQLSKKIGIRTRRLNNQILFWNEGQEEELLLTPYGIYTQSAYDGHLEGEILERMQRIAREITSRVMNFESDDGGEKRNDSIQH